MVSYIGNCRGRMPVSDYKPIVIHEQSLSIPSPSLALEVITYVYPQVVTQRAVMELLHHAGNAQ
jgi:hypothetical protein